MADKLITLDNLSQYKSLTDVQLEGIETSLQSDFQDELSSLKQELEEEIADARLPYVLVDELPNASKDCVNKLYLVPSTDIDSNDIYEEYLCVENDGTYSWEKFGSVAITEIMTNTTGDGNAITSIGVSGNTINAVKGSTFTTSSDVDDQISAAVGTTITAAALGALTGITVSGSAESSDNVVSAVAVNSNKDGITVTYSQITPASIGAATTSDVSAISGAATSAIVASSTTGSSKVTSAITALTAAISSNVLTITPTTSSIDLVSSLEDLGYDVATDDDIEGLFS